jgi:hypothetical protein
MIMWYLNVYGCTRSLLYWLEKWLWLQWEECNCDPPFSGIVFHWKLKYTFWFIQVSDCLNVKPPLRYPVKLIDTAVLNCNLLIDKLGHRIIPIVFSFKIVRKLESVQDSVVIAKSSNLGYWQLTALIWMVALVLYLQNTSMWVADQRALSSLLPLPHKVFCYMHRPHFQI